MENKHQNHKKKRLYARNQSSGAKQWELTEIFLCECGAVLEMKMNKIKLKIINGNGGKK